MSTWNNKGVLENTIDFDKFNVINISNQPLFIFRTSNEMLVYVASLIYRILSDEKHTH